MKRIQRLLLLATMFATVLSCSSGSSEKKADPPAPEDSKNVDAQSQDAYDMGDKSGGGVMGTGDVGIADHAGAWAAIYDDILVPRCVACHNPQGQARFLDLSSYQAVLTAQDDFAKRGITLLNQSDPAASYLVEVILDNDEPMPPIWSGIPRLTEMQVASLTHWIGLGFPQ